MFYAVSIVCENDMTQNDGCVVLSVFSTPKLDQTTREITKFLFQAFPFKVHLNHVVNCPSQSVERTGLKTYFLHKLVPLLLKLVGSFVGEKTVIHVGDSAEDLRQNPEGYGLGKESLAKCMGGTWSYAAFPQWQDLRMRYEWDLPAGTGNKDSEITYEYTVEHYCILSEEDKVERKRRLNVLHSRRHRERQKIEATVLREQVEELKESNGSLATHNLHLEELIEQAKAEVAKMEKLCPPTEARPALDTVAITQDVATKTLARSTANTKYSQSSAQQVMNQQGFPAETVVPFAAQPKQPPYQSPAKNESFAKGSFAAPTEQALAVHRVTHEALALHSLAQLPLSSHSGAAASSNILEQRLLGQCTQDGVLASHQRDACNRPFHPPSSFQGQHASAGTGPLSDLELISAFLNTPPHPATTAAASSLYPPGNPTRLEPASCVRADIPQPNPASLIDFSLRASAGTVPFSDLELVSALLNIPPHPATAAAASDWSDDDGSTSSGNLARAPVLRNEKSTRLAGFGWGSSLYPPGNLPRLEPASCVRTDIPRPNPARLVDFSLRASAGTVPFSDLQLVSALLKNLHLVCVPTFPDRIRPD
jgi:hypothetical protein